MQEIGISTGRVRRSHTGGSLMRVTRMVIAGLILGILASPLYAGIEWTLEKKIQLERAPLDVATSLDGQTIFVLTSGAIVVYSASNGEIIKTIPNLRRSTCFIILSISCELEIFIVGFY